MDFYATAAQVIPTLFLAMAFSSGVLFRRPSPYWDDAKDDPRYWNMTQVAGMIAVILIMGIGEIAALLTLFQGKEYWLLTSLTWFGLAAALLGVLAPVIAHQWSLWKRHIKAGGTQVGFVAGMVALCLIFFAAVLIGARGLFT